MLMAVVARYGRTVTITPEELVAATALRPNFIIGEEGSLIFSVIPAPIGKP